MFQKDIETIDWLNNYFDNCYYVKHDNFPESIFMFYDVNYVRQKKLAKLEGIDYVEKTDVTGECLFKFENGFIYLNINFIPYFISKLYGFGDIYLFIENWFKEFINESHPQILFSSFMQIYDDPSKMKIYV